MFNSQGLLIYYSYDLQHLPVAHVVDIILVGNAQTAQTSSKALKMLIKATEGLQKEICGRKVLDML